MISPRRCRTALCLPIVVMLYTVLMPIWGNNAEAIPTFARKYKTSCVTCHYAFPKLNAFGKAFRNNGFRYPEGTDPDMIKVDPLKLGAEAYKRVWPNAIWPADIDGYPPVSFHAIGRLLYFEKSDISTFEIPHELEVLFGGTIGASLSYIGEIELEHADELAYGFLLQWDFNPAVHLRLGSVGLDDGPAPPSPEAQRLTRSHYAIESLKNQSGTWRMRSGTGGGAEIWGAINGSGGRGGLTYQAGVGNGQNDAENFDVNKDKDFFGAVSYKIGGLGEAGGTEGQASEQSASYIDNSVRIGAFGYSGTATDAGGDDDEFYVAGGTLEWWYSRFILSGSAMAMNSDYLTISRDSFAWFAEGNYVIYPWMIAYLRYEYTDEDTDDDIVDAAQNLVPAVFALIRANVKAQLEVVIPLDDARTDESEVAIQFDFAF